MLSVVIITKNEEANIQRCLDSVDFADEVIIVDDYSVDRTVEIVKQEGGTVYEHGMESNFAAQRNYGMSKAKHDWILFIDADEELSKDLQKEIKTVINNEKSDIKIVGYNIKRRDYWWGREIKFGEVSTVHNEGLLRLVRRNAGVWEGKVHEEFKTDGQIETLENFMNHYPHPTIKDFLNKINLYSSLRAKELAEKGKRTNTFEIIFYPFGKFIYTYFIKLGFLDGPAGFAYSFFMSFHSFLVRAKLYQYTNMKG